jgi:hypothetical protein
MSRFSSWMHRHDAYFLWMTSENKLKVQPSAGKATASVFWDSEGNVSVRFSKTGAAVSSERYVQTSQKLKQRTGSVRPKQVSEYPPTVPILHPPTSIFLAPWRMMSEDAVLRTATTRWNTASVKSFGASAKNFTRLHTLSEAKVEKSIDEVGDFPEK